MQTLQYFAKAVTDSIPIELLNLALLREANNHYRLPQNLDTLIKHRIAPRVIMDMNISRGLSIKFNIGDCEVSSYQDNFTLIKVPEHILQGRDLISITSLLASTTLPQISNNPTGMMLDHLAGQMHGYANNNIETVSRNEFFIYKEYAQLHGMIEATVSFSKDLKEINPRYYMKFSEIVIKAAEAYIYKTLIVKMGEGSIYYGQELPIISSMINGFSESNKEYMELMNVTGSKMLFMNDKSTYHGYVNMHINL